MRVESGDRRLVWHAVHSVEAAAELVLRPGTGGGSWSYLHVSGGLLTEPLMGGRGAHLAAGLGRALRPGDALPYEPRGVCRPVRLSTTPQRFDGGTLRIVAGPQTRLFDEKTRRRLVSTAFRRDARGNRQGIRLASDGEGFAAKGQLVLLSEFVVPGDLQMAGDGQPYLLGPECQTTGGYPRIATIIPADMPRAMQAPPGAPIRLRWVDRSEGRAAMPGPPATELLTRRPEEDPHLLTRQLIDGVVTGEDGAEPGEGVR
jgi:allophanate hydrolase